ncbi:MAG: hypothetical protein R2856_02495 [Caldilineaceae bacterium]
MLDPVGDNAADQWELLRDAEPACADGEALISSSGTVMLATLSGAWTAPSERGLPRKVRPIWRMV